MDNLKSYNYHQLKIKKPIKSKKKPIKVTYISSPMMVRANNASEFRAIVQELTGQNSDLGSSEFEASLAIGGGGGDEGRSMVLNRSSIAKAEFGNGGIGEFELSNVVSSLEPNEASFWKEVSDSFLGFQFPCVLV
ncbi:hypothetical protein CsSME_00000245 [Camellia sinensis var. sinensis]